eukprot:5122541-Prymnesium_polylepis.1
MRCCVPWCPPHSTAQAAACRFVKESGAAGSLELDAMAQHALRTPSPLLPHLRGAVRGGAWPWPWAAHPRDDRHWEAKLQYLVLFTDPEANPEATAVYSRSRGSSAPPTVLQAFSWRSNPTQRANLEHRAQHTGVPQS